MQAVHFCFGVHLHQPVGNFDHVFRQHVDDVYAPLLDALERHGLFPVALHVSGPLLDWLEAHERPWVDRLGRLAADGRVELLAAGYDEPVLAVLPRDDRLEQVGRLREALRRRFGQEATGLWLTERVWEPDLAEDLAEAGIRWVLVDDRHFLVTGFERRELHRPWRTEHGGRGLALFPIDERLRYLVPFRPPEELAAYLRDLQAAGQPCAVLADDGEKFGGWPGTKQWVYADGWFDRFGAVMRRLADEGVAHLATFADTLASVPSAGLAYLPTASYREMEGWALPARAARRLAGLEHDLGAARVAGPDGALLRGAHWRHFLAKYAESNRLHKKMLAVSRLCRGRGDPTAARRAVGRAQCNDAYWHGVFGGLYLPHLRHALWRELADAEARLRLGEPLAAEVLDLDGDGHDEVWVHSDRFSAIVAPARGLGVEELTHFGSGRNHADTLTRRREAYHEEAVARAVAAADGAGHAADGGADSIHATEQALRLDALPPVDPHDRAIGCEALVPREVDLAAWAGGAAQARRRWATMAAESWTVERTTGAVEVRGRFADGLEKRVRFGVDGRCTITLRWPPDLGQPGDRLLTELSLGHPLAVTCAPDAEAWRYPIETVAKSERGLDRTVQGEAVVLRWAAGVGTASVTLAEAGGA